MSLSQEVAYMLGEFDGGVGALNVNPATAARAIGRALRTVAKKVDTQERTLQGIRAGGGGGRYSGRYTDNPQVLLGIEDTAVAAAATDTVTTEATTEMKITDFFIRDSVAEDFLITQMKISRLDLLAGSDSVPASLFKTSVQRPPLETPKLPSGTQLTVGANNISGAAKRFNGVFMGIDLARDYEKAW